MFKRRSHAGIYACIAAGAAVGMVGCAVMCSRMDMRCFKKKATRAMRNVSDFVVDNLHRMM